MMTASAAAYRASCGLMLHSLVGETETGTEEETESDKSVPGKVSTNDIYLVNSRTPLVSWAESNYDCINLNYVSKMNLVRRNSLEQVKRRFFHAPNVMHKVP